MAAAYDTYDYPSYWEGREYEHLAEVLAIKAFLKKIPKIKVVLDIGAGFGRLSQSYIYRAKKIILSDPSARLLKIARRSLKNENVRFIQSRLENLPEKIKSSKVDLVILVRVLHHIENPDNAFSIVYKLLSDKGYLILEYPNKEHWKSSINEILKGNFTFPLDIFPKDIRSEKSKRKGTLPFVNYHPDVIKEKLESHGFKVVETRSVSNIRSPFIKKIFSTQTLLFIEKYLQKPFSNIKFGPSIFILAQKRG